MLTPNSILFMRAFGAVCWGWGFRPYVNLFRSLFRILRSKNGFLAAIWICPFLPATRTPSAIGSRVLLSFIWGGNKAGVLTMLGEILTLSVVFSPICLSGRSYISHVWLLSLISTTCSSVYNFLLGAIVMLLVNLDQFSLLMLFSLFIELFACFAVSTFLMNKITMLMNFFLSRNCIKQACEQFTTRKMELMHELLGLELWGVEEQSLVLANRLEFVAGGNSSQLFERNGNQVSSLQLTKGLLCYGKWPTPPSDSF